MTAHFLIVLCYVLITVLLLVCLKTARIPIRLKIVWIVVMSVFYVVTWTQVRDLKGFSTWAPLPESFRVVWIHIQEDNKTTGKAGKIYYWVRSLDEVGLPSNPPRVHHIPWTIEAAELAESAKTRLDAGEVLNGRLSNNALIAKDAGNEEPAQGDDLQTEGNNDRQPQFEFVTVAPPSLPSKKTPIQ